MEPIVRQRVRTFWDKGEERLRAARLLYQQGFYEEAVSVAYYATLWAARALLLTEGVEPRTHEGVRGCISSEQSGSHRRSAGYSPAG